MITRENKELRATIEELNDQNRIVLQNYHNHVKNVTKKHSSGNKNIVCLFF
jgi:hypothetical protein